MPGDCPAALAPTDLCLWKTFRSKPNTIPVAHTKVFAIPPERCSPSDRNAVRNHNGMVFGFTPESRSPSTGFRTSSEPSHNEPTWQAPEAAPGSYTVYALDKSDVAVKELCGRTGV
jgi:hypothetical protein